MQLKSLKDVEVSPKERGEFDRSRRNTKSRLRRMFSILICLITASLSGCAATSFPVLGIRPDHPNFSPSQDVLIWCGSSQSGQNRDCERYRNYHEYAETLSASYRSRATLNEWGLYFAGLVGLSGSNRERGFGCYQCWHSGTQNRPLNFWIRVWSHSCCRKQR